MLEGEGFLGAFHELRDMCKLVVGVFLVDGGVPRVNSEDGGYFFYEKIWGAGKDGCVVSVFLCFLQFGEGWLIDEFI